MRILTDPAVFALVMEVTIRRVNGIREPKMGTCLRIMRRGSARARQLKVADRISNLTNLWFVHDASFVSHSVEETRAYILPFAATVNPDMFRELSDLVANRQRLLPLLGRAIEQ